MTTTRRTQMTGSLGRWLGCGWRMFARGERWVHGALVRHGTSPSAATTLLWVIKLTTLASLLYAALWLTMLALLAIAVSWALRNAGNDAHESE